MSNIKQKLFSYIPWAILVVLIGMFLAQTVQIASLDRETQALGSEVAVLRDEQEQLKAQLFIPLHAKKNATGEAATSTDGR